MTFDSVQPLHGIATLRVKLERAVHDLAVPAKCSGYRPKTAAEIAGEVREALRRFEKANGIEEGAYPAGGHPECSRPDCYESHTPRKNPETDIACPACADADAMRDPRYAHACNPKNAKGGAA